MNSIKKYRHILIILSLSSLIFSTAYGATAFSIAPLTTSTTVTSIGQGSVHYTVTNNASANIDNLSIEAGWNSMGVDLSLTQDNCSNQSLAIGQTCTFKIVIPGSSQSNSFTIQPKVCGFNGQICSKVVSDFSVNLLSHTLPIRTYQVMFQPFASQQLVGVNIKNTSDIIRATVAGTNTDGPLAISPDGKKIYMTHKNSDSGYSILVFEATATNLTQTTTSYPLSYNTSELTNPGHMVLSPDGNTLYITDNGFSGNGYPVYKINLTTGTVTGISDATTGQLANSPKAIVVSHDGKTVYISNASLSTNRVFSFSNTALSTSLSTLALTTDFTAISSMAISSDDRTLYVAGQNSRDSLPPAIAQYNINNNFSLEKIFTSAPNINGNTSSFALSPDNTNIYTVVNEGGTFYLYSINTENMTGTRITFPYMINGFISNFPYIAYSPDASTVSILNYGEDGKLTAFFNPNYPETVSSVNSAGGELTQYSHTKSAFIG